MKKLNISTYVIALVLLVLALAVFMGCEPDDSDAFPASLPDTAAVFTDGFSPGLDYTAFGDSKVTAFQLDEEVTYDKSDSAMRFDIPNQGDPESGYAGGIFFDKTGRNLSGYNVLSFWGKASQGAIIQELGFGLTDTQMYRTSITDVAFSTAWTKYYILLPDPARLTMEEGMFYFVDTPDNGKGYSFWIDELRFENSGTIGQVQAYIQNGEEVTSTVFVGQEVPVSGLGVSFSLPNGVSQAVNAAPAFFTLASSNPQVAQVVVDETTQVSTVRILAQGEAVITASMGDVAAMGSLTLQVREFEPAPLPDKVADDVISIFSDAYTNVPVDFYNGYYAPFQTTVSADFTVDGDHVLNYINYNFVGIEFNKEVPTIDATEMTHLHVDIYIPEALDPNATWRVNLRDFGADGNFDGGDDTIASQLLTTASDPALVSEQWISVDMDIRDMANKATLGQIVFDAEGDTSPRPSGFYVDNLYLYNDQGTGGGGPQPIPPTTAAPTPTLDAAQVVSIFSDAYTDVPNQGFNQYGAATFAEIPVADNATLNYKQSDNPGGNFQVIELGAENQIDATAMELTDFHVDLWFPNPVNENTAFLLKVVNIAPDITSEALIRIDANATPAMAQGQWLAIDLTMDQLQAAGLAANSNIQQVVIDLLDAGEVYIDNLYFSKSNGAGGSAPTTSAPEPPARDAADVISIFGEAYTNITGIDYDPNWGQSGHMQVNTAFDSGDGNLALAYPSFNYQGTDFSGNAQNASEMEFLHVDIWVPAGTDRQVKVSPINNGTGEGEVLVSVPLIPGSWNSVDLPIADFTGMTWDSVVQLKFDGQFNGDGSANTDPFDMYLDNVYFYKEPSAPSAAPTTSAPEPLARDAADVISIFGEAYTNITGIDYDPNWGQSGHMQVNTAFDPGDGNLALAYPSFNYQGTDFSGNAQNASEMEFLHVDIWVPAGTDRQVKVSPINNGTGEGEVLVSVPLTPGAWNSVDLPMADFTGMTWDSVVQLKFDGQFNGDGSANTDPFDIYLDNVYFYKEPSAPSTAPTTSAPAPPVRDAADVISIFGEAYTNITGIDYDPNWGQSGHMQVNTAFDPGDGNLALAYPSFNYQGTDFSGNAQNAATMQFLHVDIWVPAGTDRQVKVSPINNGTGAGEVLVSVPLTPGAWNSVDLPIGDFTGMTWDSVFQLKFDGQFNGDGSANTDPFDIYLDNVYFYKEPSAPSTAPTTSAPAPPVRDAADVISIFGEAYTNITGVDYDPNWGQSGHMQVNTAFDPGDGNLALAYPNFNYQGTDFSGNAQNAASMQFLHVDIWVPAGTDRQVKVSPINNGTGAGEVLVSVPLTPGAWNSVDLPIGDFTGMTWDSVFQLKFDGQFNGDGSANTDPFDVYLDNVYFYKN
ncbi:hypothetical protein [Sediminicola luteus]|nr:hypothetical protein [Sediminicola luteus]